MMINREDESPILIKGKLTKRLLSELGDIFLCLVLSIIFFSLIGSPIINAMSFNSDIVKVSEEMDKEREKSGLVDDKLAYIKACISYFDDGVSKDTLSSYYCDYESVSKKKMDVATFNSSILKIDEKGSLFSNAKYGVDKKASLIEDIRNKTSAYIKGDVKEENALAYKSLSDFYESSYKTAWDTFYKAKPYGDLFASYLNLTLNKGLVISSFMIGSYVLSSIILFMLVPSLFHKGTTIGKKVMRLEPRHKDGARLSIPSLIGRGSVEMICYMFIIPLDCVLIYGISGFSIPFIAAGSFVLKDSFFAIAGLALTLISLLLVIFSPSKRSLHDFVSNADIVTTDASLIGAERAKIEKKRQEEEEEKWKRQ